MAISAVGFRGPEGWDSSATSGVTGRYGATGYDRLRPEITGWGRRFLDRRTGYNRLRSAATRHSLCGTSVVHNASVLTTARRCSVDAAVWA